METTYGDRLHKPLGPSVEEFYDAVTDTFRRGGIVVVPTFALERAQELLYFLSLGIGNDRLAKSTQVFVDSPMAITATEILQHHLEGLRPQIANLIRAGHDPFHFPGLHFTRESAIENRFAIYPAIVDAIQADNCSLKIKTDSIRDARHKRQGFA